MVDEGIEISELTGQMVVLQGTIYLARLLQSQGNLPEAYQVIQKARSIAVASDFTELDDIMVDLLRVRMAIAQGDLGTAQRWVEERGLENEPGSSFENIAAAYVQEHVRKYEQIEFARLRLAQGRPQEALDLLELILPRFERLNRVWSTIEIHVLKSLAFHALGNASAALEEIERALREAQPEGFMRSFLDEGKEVASMLVRLRGRKTAPREFLERLLAAFGETPIPGAPLPTG